MVYWDEDRQKSVDTGAELGGMALIAILAILTLGLYWLWVVHEERKMDREMDREIEARARDPWFHANVDGGLASLKRGVLPVTPGGYDSRRETDPRKLERYRGTWVYVIANRLRSYSDFDSLERPEARAMKRWAQEFGIYG